MSEESLTANRRRSYTPQFKAERVAPCVQLNVSLAWLAVEHGMNPNVQHRWMSEHERYGRHTLTHAPASVKPAPLDVRTPPASPFIAIPLAATMTSPDPSQDCIRLEVMQGSTQVSLSWPISGAQQCARVRKFARNPLIYKEFDMQLHNHRHFMRVQKYPTKNGVIKKSCDAIVCNEKFEINIYLNQ